MLMRAVLTMNVNRVLERSLFVWPRPWPQRQRRVHGLEVEVVDRPLQAAQVTCETLQVDPWLAALNELPP
jgi:hypothetical protein